MLFNVVLGGLGAICGFVFIHIIPNATALQHFIGSLIGGTLGLLGGLISDVK